MIRATQAKTMANDAIFKHHEEAFDTVVKLSVALGHGETVYIHPPALTPREAQAIRSSLEYHGYTVSYRVSTGFSDSLYIHVFTIKWA